jgi:hypothetical protein
MKTKKTNYTAKNTSQKKKDMENLEIQTRKGLAKMEDGVKSMEEINDLWLSEARQLTSGFYTINCAFSRCFEEKYVFDCAYNELPEDIQGKATHISHYD